MSNLNSQRAVVYDCERVDSLILLPKASWLPQIDVTDFVRNSLSLPQEDVTNLRRYTMDRTVQSQTRMELLQTLHDRYPKDSKQQKGQTLDEFVAVAGCIACMPFDYGKTLVCYVQSTLSESADL